MELENKFDYCVIGSGIGGGTITKYLADKNKSIVVIEAGANSHKGSDIINIGRPFGLRSTTSIQKGGTSNLWHGVLSLLDAVDFEKREWINESGWPISLKELIPHYQSVSKYYGVEDFEFFFKENLTKNLQFEIDSVQFSRKILENKIFQQPLNILNFKEKLTSLEKKYRRLKILTNAKACEFVSNGENVEYLKVGIKKSKFINIKANKYILCAGALESPRILLNSKFKNKNIGRYLMDHPMGNLCQIKFKTPQKAQIYSANKYKSNIAIKSGLTFTKSIQKKYKIPNHCFYFRPSFSEGIDNKSEQVKLSLLAFKDGKINLKDIFFLFRNINIVLQILVYKLSYNATYKYADLFFVSEQTPNKESTVELSSDIKDIYGYPKSVVNWKVSSEDEKSVEKCYEILKNEALANKLYDFTHKFENIDWKKNYSSAAHHVGTCRMGNNPDDGVVDSNLKVFGTSNLFICDGSIFRTGGNVNNGFTIAAFAKRLVNHLTN
tara:strand:- start:3383 stop:4867 length:1485 start_codon:yes stop_codon:yes gene_type:complete